MVIFDGDKQDVRMDCRPSIEKKRELEEKKKLTKVIEFFILGAASVCLRTLHTVVYKGLFNVYSLYLSHYHWKRWMGMFFKILNVLTYE